MTKYSNDCDREETRYFPGVVKSFYGWHANTLATVSKLTSRTGKEAEGTSRYLIQRLGFLLMRGNKLH